MSRALQPYKYYGGKYSKLPWLLPLLSVPTNMYVEPFCGSGVVLLNRPQVKNELLNDANGDVVNLFEMLRDRGSELVSKLRITPYSRKEFELSFEKHTDPLERARRTWVRFQMSLDMTDPTGWRRDMGRSPKSSARAFGNKVDKLSKITQRLRGVTLENWDALKLLRALNPPDDALFYCDPPYVNETRNEGYRQVYDFEMSDADHEEFIDIVSKMKCRIAISGFPSDLYDTKLYKWTRVERDFQRALSVRKNNRMREVVWMNYKVPTTLI